MRGVLTGLRRQLSADPALHALAIFLHGIVIRGRSWLYSQVFHAPGLYLGPGCMVRGAKFIRFGRSCYAHGHLWLEAVSYYRGQQFKPEILLGENVAFSEGVHLSCIDRVTVGDDVLFGSHVYVSDHNHGSYRGATQSHPEHPPAQRPLGGGGPVYIEEQVWVGDNAVIVGPARIGRGAIIAANAVVRGDVARYTMVGGIPAKPLRYYNEATGQWDVPPTRAAASASVQT